MEELPFEGIWVGVLCDSCSPCPKLTVEADDTIFTCVAYLLVVVHGLLGCHCGYECAVYFHHYRLKCPITRDAVWSFDLVAEPLLSLPSEACPCY